MTEKELKAREGQQVETSPRSGEGYVRPPVDVYENEEGITLYADMPGVSAETLNVEVDKDVLSIEGKASIDVPEDAKPIYAEVRTVGYRRRFSMDRGLDGSKVEAKLKDGVLRLHLPKRLEVKARKIEISTD
jgi:HSP20 family molecular chaperone IbpA